MRILLVDDQSTVRSSIAATLKALGCSVSDYAGASEALNATVADVAPDLLVTDIDLGAGPNGFAFAETARQRWPKLPVLFISGVWGGEAPGGPQDGAMMLQKPFRLAELTKAIGTLIGAAANGGVAHPA